MYAAYAGATYTISNSWNCKNECEHPGTEGTEVLYNWDTQRVTSNGYIARNPDKKLIIVAFRGSAETGDWVESFMANPVQWPSTISGSIVVRGFLEGYLVSSEDVLQNTADLAAKYPDHNIVAVGHSLGGARASMFVADLSINYPRLVSRVQLYTYGQAKVGNDVFADYMDNLNAPMYRVVNKGDIAPHLPLVGNMVHFGTEIWLTANGQSTVCKKGDYSKCSESLPAIDYNFLDHSTYPGL
ncbi:hypothetical protein GGH96_001074 [Coemansia sp. RSA 1972]|nr:hypothetical protein GGH96_001074 [Coemansia sp. RSA 1972]